MPTKIEWCEETWNPSTGCDRVSEGCDNCYIERTIPFRMEGRRFDENGKMGVRLHPDRLDEPLHWHKPRRVFVNSLSDLFHPDVPADFILKVWETMSEAPQHTFQILTKRPQRMAGAVGAISDWLPVLPNVWLGTSIESDRYTWRANHVCDTPAAVRFLSLEPLLGPLPSLDLTDIDWVIIGGESGPGSRRIDLGWVREILAQCREAGAAPFVKQLGSCWSQRHGHSRDLKGGHIETFPEDLQVREYPR